MFTKQDTVGIPRRTLNSLCFIEYHVVPLDALEVLDVLNDQLVAGDDNME